MTMILSQQSSTSNHPDDSPTKSRRSGRNITSPDKTVASTPPASPLAFASPLDTSNNGFHANFDNNVFANPSAGGGGSHAVAGSKVSGASMRPKKVNQQLLRVDKILCRVPSHESNISDLSASLSPNHPRGPAVGNDTRGNNNFPHSGIQENSSESKNIVYSLLNECGVFENVNDLLTIVGQRSAVENNHDETPPPPPTDNSNDDVAVTGAKKKKPGFFCHDTPAVWGVAPDDIDYDDDGYTKDPTHSKEGHEPSVEYDNVELVLDESTLHPTFSSRDSPTMSAKSLSKSEQARSQSGGIQLKQFGRKSPKAGILRNKLSKFSRQAKTPSPTTMNSVAGSSTPSRGTLGVAVVESKNDPRICHMYDMTAFENEELRPEFGMKSVASSSRGGTPVSMSSARGVSPVPFLGSVKEEEDVFCQPVGGTEVDLAPVLKSDETLAEKKSLKGGKKLLKGLSSFKPSKSKSTTENNSKTCAKKKSLGSRLSKNTSSSNTTTPIQPTKKEIQEAKKWKATFDANSNKYYYYHWESKEVCWMKPVGFDEANGIENGEEAGGGEKENQLNATNDKAVVDQNKSEKSKGKKVGFGGLGMKVGKSKTPADATPKETGNGNDNAKKPEVDQQDEIKNWRATLDPTTDKEYYYNKRTKEVSWTKPACFARDYNGNTEAAEGNNEVEETSAMTSVAEKRKKTWFNKKDKKSATDTIGKGEEKQVDTVEMSSAAVPIEEGKTTTAKPEESSANNNDNVDPTAKYWRATLDASTGKTYYFNKKTKLVTWTKPEGFKEKGESSDSKKEEKAAMDDEKDADAAKEQVKAVETAAAALQELETDATDGDENAAHEQPEDDMSEIEGLSDDEVIGNVKPTKTTKEDAPFDEPDAPFDEPFDEDAPIANPSPKRAHFKPHQPKPAPPTKEESEDEDEDEQEDSFEGEPSSDHLLGAGQPLYGRVKSLKSIDFDSSRQRTFDTKMTDTTRKAANTAHGSGSGLNKDDTFESSLNNSIASEIFTDDNKQHSRGQRNRDDVNDSNIGRNRPSKQQPSESNTARRSLKDLLPQLPATPPRSSRNNDRSSPRNRASSNRNSGRSSSSRRYNTKQAENLGNSSDDESLNEEEDQLDDSCWSDDDVSALSGIGNESLESKKKKRMMKQRGGRGVSREDKRDGKGDGRHRKSSKEEKSSSKRNKDDTQQKTPQSDNAKEWTQQELDSFISKNDWGSVAKYINDMRVNKGNTNRPNEQNIASGRKEPSLREIQERMENNRTLQRESSSTSAPKSRFGARSQMQHDELSQGEDSRSQGVESESLWQSLSSASYESSDVEGTESLSQYHQQQRRRKQRSLSRSSKKQSTPREMLL
mmetsp:Transcript_17463/g.37738  ORF Transcript_17463/g.37738 Transcript_17463/m.37738 type:complete len:1343 (+) Transcript_17463:143-4171(+)